MKQTNKLFNELEIPEIELDGILEVQKYVEEYEKALKKMGYIYKEPKSKYVTENEISYYIEPKINY